jgi:signal transduction histidine kinase/CheY-like chemotaxis protein
MWQTILAGREWRGEICNKKKNGELYWETVSISPIRNPAGSVTHFVGIKEDITERKHAEVQILRAQKMESIQSVLSNIAQNFNNILNNVLGFALLVKKYAGDAAKVTRYGDVIEQSAGRGAQLTDRLLALSRTEHGEMGEVRPDDVVRDAVGLLPPTHPAGVSVRIEVASDVRTLLADRGDLAAAIGHILRNALESIQEHTGTGTILLRAGNVTPEDQSFPLSGEARTFPWVAIHIADSGSGIAPEIRDRIFEPLFTTKEHTQHSGLGLSIVYNTVRRHRGVVTVESEPGKGAVFHLHLPAYVPAAAERVDSPLSGNGEVVLLVDDEPAMREFGKELLSEYGYTVLLATNGEEAVEVFREHAAGVDLVILDLVMPKMDGGQTFLEMKKIRNDVRACFCTGYTSDQVITSLLEEEKLKAIKKPFQAQEFLSMVRQVIKER